MLAEPLVILRITVMDVPPRGREKLFEELLQAERHRHGPRRLRAWTGRT